SVGGARRPAYRIGCRDFVRVVDDDATCRHRRETDLHPSPARGERHGATQIAHDAVVGVHGAADVDAPIGLVDYDRVEGYLKARIGNTADVGPLLEGPDVRVYLAARDNDVAREAMVYGDYQLPG